MASILIIEDDLVDQMAIKRSLAPFKTIQFTYAASLKEAMALLADHAYDLIITDYFLPDGLGTDLPKVDCPIYLMTGLSEMPDPNISHDFVEVLIKDRENSHLQKIPKIIQLRFNDKTILQNQTYKRLPPLQQLSINFQKNHLLFLDILQEMQNQFEQALLQLNAYPGELTLQDLFQLAHKLKSQFSLGSFNEGTLNAEKLERLSQDKEATPEHIQEVITLVQNSIHQALQAIQKESGDRKS